MLSNDWKYGFATHELREAFIIRGYGLGPAEHDYLKHYLLKPGDVYIEAGAEKGRTGFLAQAMGATVILIEPDPKAMKVIHEKQSQHYLNATTVEAALWSQKGHASFTQGPGNGNRIELSESGIIVNVETLPNIIKELNITKVNLFACDIEGAEVEVVKTLDPKTVLNVAIASYHLGTFEKVENQIMKVLETKGYKNISYEDGLVFASSSDRNC